MRKRKTFTELQAEARRGAMLYFLADDAQYTMSTHLLLAALRSTGHGRYLNEVEDDARWLAERGLVTLEVADGMTIATLTRKGLDVAQGVKRPRPEA